MREREKNFHVLGRTTKYPQKPVLGQAKDRSQGNPCL